MTQSVLFSGLSVIDFNSMIARVVGEEVEKKFQLFMLQQKEQAKEYLTAKETAAILGVSLPTLNAWEKAGYLLPVRVNTRVRYKHADVTEAFNRKTLRVA